MPLTSPRASAPLARRPVYIDQAATPFERVLAENVDELNKTANNHPVVMASVTTTYTVTEFDAGAFCDASGGAFTVTLPSAVGRKSRRLVFFKTDSSGNAVTLDGNGSETINGATTDALSSQYSVLEIISDGSNWFIVSPGVA